MLVSLPIDVLCELFLFGIPTAGQSRTLRSLRETSTKGKWLCNYLATEVHQLRLRQTQQACRALPLWLPIVRESTMEEWVTHAVGLLRTEWRQQWRCAFAQHRQNRLVSLRHMHSKEMKLQKVFGLTDLVSDDVFMSQSTAHFWSIMRRGHAMRQTSPQILHVDLASVPGWVGCAMDACASLLFLQRCSDILDAGSTWGLSKLIPIAMSCTARILSIRDFALEHIGRQDFAVLLHKQFDVNFTSGLHSDVCKLLTQHRTLVSVSAAHQDFKIGKLAAQLRWEKQCVTEELREHPNFALLVKKFKASLPL